MKEIQYKTFSWRTHKKNWRIKRPNVCQFELTFRCDLHCRHCYSNCYNKQSYVKKELTTSEVKFILDKLHRAGVIWLCFTGGDPLTKPDFLEIYSYAKDKGFLITIFTNAYSMTKEIANYLKKNPPFVIEATLNAVSKELYEYISQVEGSYDKVMQGLNLILERKLPLKIKTQVTNDNLGELSKIKAFLNNLDIEFRPSVFLHARLDGDLTPCSLRIRPEEVVRLNGGSHVPRNTLHVAGNRSQVTRYTGRDDTCYVGHDTRYSTLSNNLFNCAIGGGDGIHIDPYGNIIPCNCIREPKINPVRNFAQKDGNSGISNGVNLLEKSIEEAQKNILNWVRTGRFTIDSKCKTCLIRESCYSCPGKALLEKGSLEESVEWFCELAHLITKKTTVKLLRAKISSL